MIKKSKFQTLIESQNDYKNLGYNYKNNLIGNFVSSYIYYNEELQDLIHKLDDFLKLMIYQVKLIKKQTNYTIRKDEDNFN
jgi:hypothetical protein